MNSKTSCLLPLRHLRVVQVIADLRLHLRQNLQLLTERHDLFHREILLLQRHPETESVAVQPGLEVLPA